MHILKTISVGILVLATCNTLFAQQRTATAQASSKWRTLFAIAGSGGGFALGLFTGLAVFDDSINSDRKVWTTAALSAVGGGVGGYFLGRSLDRRQTRTNITREADQFYQTLMKSSSTLQRVDTVRELGMRQNLELRVARLSPYSSYSVTTEHADLNRDYLASTLQKINATP